MSKVCLPRGELVKARKLDQTTLIHGLSTLDLGLWTNYLT